MKINWRRRLLCGALTASALLVAPLASFGQTPTLFGALSNFDCYNDTGEVTHGFEIELDGIQVQDAVYNFSSTRYGGPQVIAFPGGVYVRYSASYDPQSQQWSAGTEIPAAATPTSGHSCVLTNIAGCDHYGVSTAANPTNVIYRWLVADPAIPGNLLRFGTNVSIPQPTVTVTPGANGAPPDVEFQVVMPPPPPPEIPKPELQFGEAQWVQVFKLNVDRQVGLDELVGGNPIVPENAADLETGWKLLQYNPHSANSGVLKNQGGMNSNNGSVVRRYEFTKFAGAYDPATHKAICGGDGTCTTPQPGELGDYIGSQMSAANVGVPTLTVTKVGAVGEVDSNDGNIRCPNTCTSTYAAGTAVTLTAVPKKGVAFAGWSGACAGNQLTCTVTVNDAVAVTAKFVNVFPLQISKSGTGTVTGPKLNCGATCAATFAAGAVVKLTATPGAGLGVIWGGACSGTSRTCTVTVTKSTSVQVKFK
ncbi:MAG: hypothetical protein ABI693_34975 [Bryobacteraceae bacterium]